MMPYALPSRVPVWLDCDPGHDDALAIILAGYSPKLRLLGLSTVSGNLSLESTTQNALNITNVSGLGYLPVVAGAAKPLLRAPRYCPEIHGESGLDALGHEALPPLPADRRPVASKAVNYMFHCIHNHVASHPTDKVTLVATGSLTNVALLLSVFPEVAADLTEIVLMGGSCGRGNTGSVAEFNIQVDPEAAAIVFNNGLVPVVMVPLEVTHTALVTANVMQCVACGGSNILHPGAGASSPSKRAFGPSTPSKAESVPAQLFDIEHAPVHAATPYRRLIVSLLQFFASTYNTVFGMPDPPLHDPCAIMYVIDPSLFTTRRCRVDIETSSAFSAGQTVVDLLNINKHPEHEKNATVALSMDVPAFWRHMLDAITAADARSILNPHAVHALTSPRGGAVSALASPTGSATAAIDPIAHATPQAAPVLADAFSGVAEVADRDSGRSEVVLPAAGGMIPIPVASATNQDDTVACTGAIDRDSSPPAVVLDNVLGRPLGSIIAPSEGCSEAQGAAAESVDIGSASTAAATQSTAMPEEAPITLALTSESLSSDGLSSTAAGDSTAVTPAPQSMDGVTMVQAAAIGNDISPEQVQHLAASRHDAVTSMQTVPPASVAQASSLQSDLSAITA